MRLTSRPQLARPVHHFIYLEISRFCVKRCKKYKGSLKREGAVKRRHNLTSHSGGGFVYFTNCVRCSIFRVCPISNGSCRLLVVLMITGITHRSTVNIKGKISTTCKFHLVPIWNFRSGMDLK